MIISRSRIALLLALAAVGLAGALHFHFLKRGKDAVVVEIKDYELFLANLRERSPRTLNLRFRGTRARYNWLDDDRDSVVCGEVSFGMNYVPFYALRMPDGDWDAVIGGRWRDRIGSHYSDQALQARADEILGSKGSIGGSDHVRSKARIEEFLGDGIEEACG